ncbi:MAG: ATP-binding protein [Chitinophagaceae bacterium]|nr:ATP-binding protein [Chitinophagaceae bacterium]
MTMNNFKPFDPLKAKSLADTEVAALAQKREIKNILGSYVGWYDPFCELIQNALDSIEERAANEDNYEPTIWIGINIKNNSLSVTDNGIGLDEDKFQKFLCPDISFKSGKTRGHKGVGATYLAYGFNYIQVATKFPGFSAVGKMEGSRNWLNDENPSGNPQMKQDEKVYAKAFSEIDRGVSIFVKFDQSTHPKDLKWIVADQAEEWLKILSVKTGLGAFTANNDIKVVLKVVDRDGTKTEVVQKGIEYFLPHNAVQKSASASEINNKLDELFKKKGKNLIYHQGLKTLMLFTNDGQQTSFLSWQKTVGLKLTKTR